MIRQLNDFSPTLKLYAPQADYSRFTAKRYAQTIFWANISHERVLSFDSLFNLACRNAPFCCTFGHNEKQQGEQWLHRSAKPHWINTEGCLWLYEKSKCKWYIWISMALLDLVTLQLSRINLGTFLRWTVPAKFISFFCEDVCQNSTKIICSHVQQ